MTEFEKIRMQEIKDDFLKETGVFIAKKRKYCNLTQKELGEYLEVAATTVSRYENGDIEIPGSSLALISSVCDFPMAEYLNAWVHLGLKDVFKNSLELIKNGKQRKRKESYTERFYDVQQVKESPVEYITTEKTDSNIVDIMSSVCKEEEKNDIVLFGTLLEILENKELQIKLTTTLIEHYINSRPECDDKKQLIAYYEKIISQTNHIK